MLGLLFAPVPVTGADTYWHATFSHLGLIAAQQYYD